MASGSQSGAYVAVRQQRTRHHGECVGPGSFLFVDNALNDPTALRRIPASALRNHQATLLIRANRTGDPARSHDSCSVPSGRVRRLLHRLNPGVGDSAGGEHSDFEQPSEADKVARVIEQWGLPMPVGLLHQPVGADAWIEKIQGDPQVDLTHVRAIELEALLEWGNAIWRPADYHYRLPSGEHAAGFVKLTDAIREPRDAEVLASWLLPHLRPEVGFVLDTGTMTPIYEAAVKRATEAKMATGPVSVLEHYPRTFVDVHDAVEDAAGGQGRVLAVLSVNSSGSVRDRIISAMDRITGLDQPCLVVLVDKDRPSTEQRIETWSPLPGHDPVIQRGAAARETCPLCTDSKRSRLIPINPFTFDGMAQGEMLPIMPSIRDAQGNWELWQECAEGDGAVAVESRSALTSAVARPSSHPMTVRIDIETLLGKDAFRELVEARLQRLISAHADRSDPLDPVRWTREPFRAEADLVLVPEHELGQDGFESFWQRLEPLIAPGAQIASFPIEGELPAELKAQIAAATDILIFALGSVSGHSLQRALFAVQQSDHKRDYRLQGLVLHARLPTSREWQTLCNSFDRCLHAGWIFFLPESSPLREEEKSLKRLDPGSYEGGAASFLERRLRLCTGEVIGEKPPLFWGSGSGAELTQNSIFGQRLDARTTFAAVGAAMSRGRIDHDRQTPEVRVFDLAGMLHSYYDPLIIASFFRWLGPYEAWWGWKAEEATRTINNLFGRVGDNHRALQILVPELLLASAQGKVHDAAVEVVLAQAEPLRTRADGDVAAAIDLGVDLAKTLN